MAVTALERKHLAEFVTIVTTQRICYKLILNPTQNSTRSVPESF